MGQEVLGKELKIKQLPLEYNFGHNGLGSTQATKLW